ncbi:hypothetical protein QJS76_13120, partial [Enterococcus faecium]|uniref:hypothetical protein n=1 Tax=Enterococcus faecium TaxID=1352 RepID=UPI00396C9E0A
MVKDCIKALNAAGNIWNLTVIWVPGHANISGNEKADLLAKMAVDIHPSWSEIVPLTISQVFTKVKEICMAAFE